MLYQTVFVTILKMASASTTACMSLSLICLFAGPTPRIVCAKWTTSRSQLQTKGKLRKKTEKSEELQLTVQLSPDTLSKSPHKSLVLLATVKIRKALQDCRCKIHTTVTLSGQDLNETSEIDGEREIDFVLDLVPQK